MVIAMVLSIKKKSLNEKITNSTTCGDLSVP